VCSSDLRKTYCESDHRVEILQRAVHVQNARSPRAGLGARTQGQATQRRVEDHPLQRPHNPQTVGREAGFATVRIFGLRATLRVPIDPLRPRDRFLPTAPHIAALWPWHGATVQQAIQTVPTLFAPSSLSQENQKSVCLS